MTASDKPTSPGDRDRLLQSCKALVYKWVSVHFKSFLDKLDEQLFRMADKAGSTIEQNRYLQAHTELRARRRWLEKQLLEHSRLAYANFLDRIDTASAVTQNESELKLVDNDALEQSIAITAMTRRASTDYSEALFALNQRLSALVGGAKIDDLGNPVAPAVFTEALRDALRELTLDTASKLVFYKIYDNALLTKLDKLYQLLNHHLKTAGVLPHLRYQIRKEDSALPEELANHNSPETTTKQSDLMALVQRLQSALALQRAPVAHPRPQQQILRDLQPLQHESARVLSAAKTQQAVLETQREDLAQQIQRETRSAAPIDADVIEIVGLLFEYMLSDEQLPDSVKALLSYLHTPFLRIALLDKAFFNSPQHPARQLLNSLVAAGERWVESEGKHRSDVYQQIKATVQRILSEFDNDVRLFSQLAFDFNHYLRQHSRRVRLAEQRAQQAARGEDTLKEIRLRVDRYLKQKISDDQLPEAVAKLLFEPWANFLAFNLLRFGSTSPQWQAAAQVVDDVLRYARPQGIDQQELWTLRDSLNERIAHGFQTVGYEIEAGQLLLDALHQCRSKSEPVTAAVPPSAPLPQRAADIDAPIAPSPELAADPLLEKLSKVEFGTWFVFLADRPRKEQLQAKLAWSNSRTQHYMFVNRLGQQTAVKTGAELVTDIRAGRTRILEQRPSVPFFEKALERIAEQLQPRRPPP